METTTNTAPPQNGTHTDVYKLINDKIIARLEEGIIPWQETWKDVHGHMPTNLVTKHPYRGINTVLLLLKRYERNLFLTYKQVGEIGAKVKENEKGHQVVFWKVDGTIKDDKKIALRYYSVFNISQCENIPENLIPADILPVAEPIRACEDIVLNDPDSPDYTSKGQKPYYDPLHDIINMPKLKFFKSEEAHYAVLFHQLMHSTGHHSRLYRKTLIEMSEYGWDSFSQEELVAELGTCQLQSITGIAEFEQSPDHIQGLLDKLKKDKRLIFTAATLAQKAIDHILNIQKVEEDKPEEEQILL